MNHSHQKPTPPRVRQLLLSNLWRGSFGEANFLQSGPRSLRDTGEAGCGKISNKFAIRCKSSGVPLFFSPFFFLNQSGNRNPTPTSTARRAGGCRCGQRAAPGLAAQRAHAQAGASGPARHGRPAEAHSTVRVALSPGGHHAEPVPCLILVLLRWVPGARNKPSDALSMSPNVGLGWSVQAKPSSRWIS